MSEGTGYALRQLHAVTADMVAKGTLTRTPQLNPFTISILSVTMHLGFIDAVTTATSSMMRQPTVGMKTIVMLALCSDGYEINHRVLVGVSREAMMKLWDIMESKSMSFMAETYRHQVMLGRSSSHYFQLFTNMPTPISIRTSKDDPARADARNEHMKSHYEGTLATTLIATDWDTTAWDFESGPEVYLCIEDMDSDAMVMVEQATGVVQSQWYIPDAPA